MPFLDGPDPLLRVQPEVAVGDHAGGLLERRLKAGDLASSCTQALPGGRFEVGRRFEVQRRRPTAGREGNMKRIGSMIAVAALAITLIVTSLMPAQATHTEAHLRRQINRLESQVSALKNDVTGLRRDVNDLLHDVFDCQILVDPPEQFTDGLFYHDLYYSASCAGAASPRKIGR
jgi:hypothetical protein